MPQAISCRKPFKEWKQGGGLADGAPIYEVAYRLSRVILSSSACFLLLVGIIWSTWLYITLLGWFLKLFVKYLWQFWRSSCFGTVIASDCVSGVGHTHVCHILSQSDSNHHTLACASSAAFPFWRAFAASYTSSLKIERLNLRSYGKIVQATESATVVW